MSGRPRVLVIRGGAIGDFILTLPAIRLLRESIPGCHLEALGYPGIVDLAKAAGLADAVRSLEHRTMAPLFAKGAAIDEALCDYLRGFNLIVSYLYDPDGHFRGNLERIGVKTLIAASHRVEEGRGHAVHQLARPLERLAFFLEDPRPRIALEIMRGGADAVRIAIHPGSGSLRKNWALANWLRLGGEITAAFPKATITWITGEAERERGITGQVADSLRDSQAEHLDSLPLADLARELGSCSAFIGHDSGISHLAAACGLPCQLFFGPTDPATWAPLNDGVAVLRAAGGDLANLGFEEAWAAVCAFLQQRIV